MSLMLDEEVALGNDSRYRSFIVNIERALKQFEISNEWPDLISYLARLKKTIETNEQFHFIPKRITLLKRLAECLHPALPSGVHLKTLEIYEIILRMIEKRQLQRDIILYSYGLFSLLPVAALPVKPVLLNIYETYFLPLGETLNPILSGFLIGLFSALEEGADYYNRVIVLLDNLTNRIDEFYFYTCIWSSIHLVASVRHSAITFIINHFDKRKNIEDQFHLIGLSVETTVSALCTCLHDHEQSLVQRSTLDFLLICLPLHKKQLSKIHLVKIMCAILHILLKRDMSLNRRIYEWFLGTNDSCKDMTNQQHEVNDSVDSSAYFLAYTQEILIESLINSLNTTTKHVKVNEDDNKQISSWTLTKLIRILLVLVDKPDVGPNIIESIFMNYLLLVYEQAYQPAKKSIANNIQQENDYSETLKTFNMLLDTLEPYFIWEFLTKNFETILNQQHDQNSMTMEQLCSIINMLLDISSLESLTDIQSEHLPEMLYRLIKIMNNNLEKLTPTQTTLCLEILLKILKNIVPTDTNHHLSIFYRSNSVQEQIRESNLIDSDTEDENDQLQNLILITDQQDSHVIERLLHQMVHKVEKQIYQFSQKKPVQSPSKATLESINHIEKSIKLYKIFFHRFILTYFLDRNQMPTITEQFQTIYSIICNRTNDNLFARFNRYQQFNQFDFKLTENIDQYKTAFEDCCKLLIEFCYFSKQSSINDSPGEIRKTDIDDWLMDLCVLALCRTGYFSFQTIAISILIELFDYALKKKKSTDNPTNSFSLFLNETDFFQYIIAYLWENLSEKYNREYNLKAAYLLLILHSMLPNNLCEDLVCKQLSFTNNQQILIDINIIEGYKRFFKLWNSTRDLTNINKSFQNCLIHVLSILKESDHHCLKSMVEQWIYDCFMRGDMCRIFDVLLIMLLHSDTTRVSNSEVVHESNGEIDDNNEMTFSLTFDDGNHEDYDDESTGDHDTEHDETDGDKRSRTISLANSSENIQHLKPTTKSPSITNIAPPIISNFLSFSPLIISRSMKQRAPTMPLLTNKPSSPSELTNINPPRSHSMPNDPLDSPDAYILFYTQSYDYPRVILSMNIIECLINLLPQQLIHTLLITSNIQTSSISIYNNQMHELCSKHRLSSENNQEYQSYLYLLLKTLLVFTYSYHQKSIDIQENYQVQIHSLIVLTYICHDLSILCMDNTLLINYVINLLKKISFQKIILRLFNRIISKNVDINCLHEQLIKQYLKQLSQLLEEIILLENIISSTDTLVNQPMFMSTILQYLKQIHSIENHRYIINLIIRILPHSGSALKTISIRIIEQICQNLCFIIQYHSQQETKIKSEILSSFDAVDYIIHLIQRLSHICNYCFGNTQNLTPIVCPQQWMKRTTTNPNDLSETRQILLTKLPLILSSLLFLWKTLSIDRINSIWLINNIKKIRETIIEFISSLTKSNGVPFIRAIVHCWKERKRQQKSDDIQALINILMSINNYSINDMIYNMNELIQTQTKKRNYVIWCLQCLLGFLEEQNNVSIHCWTTLAIMLKECLAQSGASSSITFLIIKILSLYIKQSPSLVEKRDLKDLQDITMKALENCNTIVASSLEQTKWLRKNLQVRLTQSDQDSTTSESLSEHDPPPQLENTSPESDTSSSSKSPPVFENSSLIALTILGEYAAKLLDAVDDKDRVVIPYLQNLIGNVMPYVRTHVLSNAPSYRSASVLLMNISQYSYTKKAWRKEVFEQLFDPGFFQVDLITLRSWKIIIDNMFTNEKAISFKDFMSRINTVQTGLFVSKEQEYEQRAMLIKRFAFVVYSSEKNQSNRHSPAIFECISDLLKLLQIPVLHTQMFLFFRVILIRLSKKNLMTFWPTIMSELIQVLLQLEHDLSVDIEGDINKSKIQRMTMNDISQTYISSASLKMYLYACKLLDILLAMPYAEVDYFQLFRSAFVADHGTTSQTNPHDTFATFSIRLAKLFEEKLQSMSPTLRNYLSAIKISHGPLLRLRSISNIIELFPFFNCLSLYDNFYFKNEQIPLSDKINDIETSVLEDFIESWI